MKNLKISTSNCSLLQGDCLEIMPSLPDDSVDCILSDLPYGTTVNSWDSVLPLDELWLEYNRLIKPNGAIILTSIQPFTTTLIASNIKNFKYEWIWKKTISSNSLNAKKMPLRQHESVLVFSGPSSKVRYFPIMTEGKPYTTQPQHFKSSNYGKQKRPSLNNPGIRYPTSVIEIPNPRIKNGHPTQKPIELMKYFIATYTLERETILDNCMGSGSTGVASYLMGRKFIGIEINEYYFNLAAERIQSVNDVLEF